MKIMKLIILALYILCMALCASSCNNSQPQTKPGVHIEGKNGGDLEINKKKLEINGKNGGELKMDGNGAKIKDGHTNQ